MSEELIKIGDKVEVTWCFTAQRAITRKGRIIQLSRGSGDLLQIEFPGVTEAINPNFWALQSIKKIYEPPTQKD